jgi:diaminobutyrate-2-oxoglutarate transaminase
VTATVALRKFWSNDELIADVARRGAVVHARLSELARQIPGSRVKGRAMMVGIEMDGVVAAQVNRTCARDGLIIERCGPRGEVVKVLAPLTTPDGLLEQGLDILAGAIHAAMRAPVAISA